MYDGKEVAIQQVSSSAGQGDDNDLLGFRAARPESYGRPYGRPMSDVPTVDPEAET